MLFSIAHLKRASFILLICSALSCDNSKIQIEKDFIINGHWNEYNNAILIERMTVVDSTLNIFSPDFKEEPNHWNIVNKLEIDSTFQCYYGGLNIKNDLPKLKGKVYFDRDNGWNWSLNGKSSSTIGDLTNNTWYKFSLLHTGAIYHYVYIDSAGQSYRFTANLQNY